MAGTFALTSGLWFSVIKGKKAAMGYVFIWKGKKLYKGIRMVGCGRLQTDMLPWNLWETQWNGKK